MEKYAIVTGGSRGIGKEICLKLAQENGYHILINCHQNIEAAKEVQMQIRNFGLKADILQFDVSNNQQTTQVLTDWETKNPDALVEVIVNNAGITKDGLLMWMDYSDWSQVIKTSIDGFYNVTRFFIQKMLRNRYGRIINIASTSGVKGTPGQTNYSAAKGALIAATKSLAQEVGKRNITVNAVAPGFIKTDMTQDLDETQLLDLIPVHRFGEPQEVADLVSFLASKKSSYITGEVININGGIN